MITYHRSPSLIRRARQLGTAWKIGLGFATVAVLMLLLAAAAHLGQRRVSQRLETIAAVRFPSSRSVDAITIGQMQVFRFVNGLMIRGLSAADRKIARTRLADGLAAVDEGRKAYDDLPRGDRSEAIWRATAAPYAEWKRAVQAVAEAAGARDAAELTGRDVASAEARLFAAWYGSRKALAALDAPMKELADQTAFEVEDERRRAADAVRTSTALMVMAILLGLVGLVIVGVMVARTVARNVQGLAGEARRLTLALAEEGDFEARGDAAKVSAEYRPVVVGMNDIVEAFTRRFRIVIEYMEKISRGELPPAITRENRGEFAVARDAINRAIEAIGRLVTDVELLSRAGEEGRLQVRADTSRHHGEFQRIVAGVNATLDAMLRPMEEAAHVLEALAKRDLRARVEGDYGGDHARIKEALNATAAALHDAIAQVTDSARHVSAAAGQIASASEEVAAGASEQASALEETSSSLESIAATTRQAAEDAQEANGLAQQASTAAAGGTAAMEQMSRAMERIKAAAEGTSEIIKNINEIAFQTNLLALNAAVEAARAGEAGRGFAVVAEEVRSLALRCKEAATKTDELIRQSVNEAGEGESTSKDVQERLRNITESVGKVSGIVAEIAAAAREQAAGIEQVNKAVAQVGHVTQQNAASSEESSSAAAELSGQSEELAAMVATFQLNASSGTAQRSSTKAGGAVLRSNGAAARMEIPIRRPERNVAPAGGAFKEF
jgi:methyl-accepting chemotaxis protein